MKPTLILLVALSVAAPAVAQSRGGGGAHWFNAPADVPVIAVRPFLDVGIEQFTAAKTFDAVFGDTASPLWGGGLQVAVWRGRVYAEVAGSRLLKKNGELVGERAFVSDGTAYPLGIPLRSTIKSIDVVGGYRFNVSPHVIPYVGAGIGSYRYTERSDFADPSENVDVTHRGYIFDGGVELRVSRWIGVGVDAHYTRVPGILGGGGVSRQFAEDTTNAQRNREKDLGGWAARLRLLVGR
jgi:opacity protein-like surface antigen